MLITADKREGLAEIYNQLVDLVGIENTEEIYKNMKGQQITFPMRLYRTDYISKICLLYTSLLSMICHADAVPRILRAL